MTRTADAASPAPAGADPLARYEIHELLGRGGMACVYRATDRALGRQVALKQLVVDEAAPTRASVAALFEREFHTLAQLRHPHVIAVYDYGVRTDGSPFYTMELLDGGDLRERSPVDWQQACRLVFDVCSALALLHSRRLLHRDISPRNIRCTQGGQAKLIDFGAMARMSAGGAEVVGTPAFTAPETLQRLALDARTDLYSLGVTLYYALTNRVPYSARAFADLLTAWGSKPVRPSVFVPEIPAALDDLVLALISVEPALRPQSAFEVMQQLATCAGLHAEESEAVARAYLSTPTLVGRDDALSQLREQMRNSRLLRVAGVILEGPPGVGRSRLLDACALEAQMQGFTVLRATASGTHEAFATARALANHLLDAMPLGDPSAEFPELFSSSVAAPANDVGESAPHARPTLRNFADPTVDPERLQRALRRWLRSVSHTHPLLIAVDDVHKIDLPSAALLAELIDKTERGGMLLALTADSGDAGGDALSALSRRCTAFALAPLTQEQTQELFASLFGDVANLSMLAAEIHRVARGNPRRSLELAQHLVDRGLIRYASGIWTLPGALSHEDLPRSAAAAMHGRISRLSVHARFLGRAQALAYYDTFSDAQYRALAPDLSSLEIELAISELLAEGALVRDGAIYMLADRIWSATFIADLDPEQTQRCHRALAAMYGSEVPIAAIHHAFAGGLDRQALEWLDDRNEANRSVSDLLQLLAHNAGKMMWCYPRAIETARALGRSSRAILDLRRWQYMGNVVTQELPDVESARIWFDQLAHDSGLELYRRDTERANPSDRLMYALTTAQQRYLATPERERGYPVDEAIRKLCEYVVISIAIGGRTLESGLVYRLPEMLEPFVALSPLLDSIWNNALATRCAHECRYETARDLWRDTLTKLAALTAADAKETFIPALRNAITSAMGMMEVHLGLKSAAAWAERLDDDPFQRIGALNLRKIVRLEQGDAEGADRLRRQAEVLALQLQVPQMFTSVLSMEVNAYAKSRDLAGVAQLIEQMKALAARYPAWAASLLQAEASFQLLRGDYEAAKAKFEKCIELTRVDEHGESSNVGIWLAAQAGLAECQLGLGRDEDARVSASAALRVCESKQLVAASFDLVRILALAEAKLGDARAAERMDALIALQNQIGSTGLRMGLSYEARARIAIWSADAPAFERFAELTAREYRHGARNSLAARYERLMNEAERAGMHAKVSLADFEALAGVDSSALGSDDLLTVITRTMAGHNSSDERTQLALQMICAAHGTSAGHLYLLTAAGLVLRASHGTGTPPAELAERVSRYVMNEQHRAREMDDMITGDLPEDDALTSLVQTEGASYELLPLACVLEATSTLAGVAVIQVEETRLRNDKQAQLLNTLAASLLQTGDSHGMRLSTLD